MIPCASRPVAHLPARLLGGLFLICTASLVGCAATAQRAGTVSLAEAPVVTGDNNHTETVTGLLASSLMSNIEKTDEVDNKLESAAVKVENNAAKIGDIEARLTMRDNKADPVQTIVYGIIGLSFMLGSIVGAWKLVQYLLHKAECRFTTCNGIITRAKPPTRIEDE